MTFAPTIYIDRRKLWRRMRYNRAFSLLASYVVPDRRLRSTVGRLLRRIPGVRTFAYTQLGMVFFDRILTPRFSADVVELRAYDQDVRQVLVDNATVPMESATSGRAIDYFVS